MNSLMSDTEIPNVLCVDIGGTSTKAGVVNQAGEMHFVDSIPTKPDVHSYIDNLVSLIGKTLAQARSRGQETAQMGVAVAGFIDDRREHLFYNSNLSWLERFPLRSHLQEKFPGFAIGPETAWGGGNRCRECARQHVKPRGRADADAA